MPVTLMQVEALCESPVVDGRPSVGELIEASVTAGQLRSAVIFRRFQYDGLREVTQ